MSEGPGPNIGVTIPGESPYRRENIKEVTEEVKEEKNFEVCTPKEAVVKQGRVRKRKKITYTHLQEHEEGLKWSVLIVPPDGEPEHFEFPA